jgi:hypothetical protein
MTSRIITINRRFLLMCNRLRFHAWIFSSMTRLTCPYQQWMIRLLSRSKWACTSVTSITWHCRWHMGSRLPFGRCAVVTTSAWARGDACMTEGCASKRGEVFMATVTGGCSWHMISWLGQSLSTIMTSCTCTWHDTRMIHRSGNPASSAMTSITRLSSWNMSSCFTRGTAAVMTGGTASGNNWCMAKRSRKPCCCSMTTITWSCSG